MKKFIAVVLIAVSLLTLSGCTLPPRKISTVEGNVNTYHEMSDGTWKTDKYTYQHRLVLEDSIPGTGYTAQYTVLSNRDDLTFHQVFLASGISSSTSAYFSEDDAVIVRSVFWENEQ